MKTSETGRVQGLDAMPFVVAIALLVGFGVMVPRDSVAYQIQFSRDQFSEQTNVLSSVTNFSISIEVLGPLAPGLFVNPELGDIEFLIEGALDPMTPARTANPAFINFAVADLPLLRGQEFYDLGNALSFEISSGADLNDGLQISELVGTGLVFEFDGRELGTGRYHPPLFELFSDGTGRLRNSNNTGGINPATGVEVNATIGDEYVTELGFEPTTLTIAVSEPRMGTLPAIATAMLCAALRRGTSARSRGTLFPHRRGSRVSQRGSNSDRWAPLFQPCLTQRCIAARIDFRA